MPKLVIVESPAKAKTIGRFLGSGYIVEASYGHVRDLPSKADEIPEKVRKQNWARLGVDVANAFEPLYIVPPEKKRHIDRLKKALAQADAVLMATDEDREGESIVWHLLEVLKPRVPVERIAFHEITPEAIRHAVQNPRAVDDNLVRAQETRRILDRLFGYTLSPVLWKKVQSGLSAGRVQSVAVRLCVMRERERARFRQSVYWDLSAELAAGKKPFEATLVRLGSKRVASGRDFDPSTGELKGAETLLLDEAAAQGLAVALQSTRPWQVDRLEKKPERQRPAPPFITSTLQQEANRKLGFSAKRTMSVAQELYEGLDIGGGERVGLITYMRTDSVTLSERALSEARQVITQLYGKDYALAQPRQYQGKSRNAQEAHEAIRPTMLGRTPDSLREFLDRDQFRLYDLIWKRTLASQMAEARLLRTLVEIGVQASARDRAVFQTSGKEIEFPGFLRAYVEGSDDPAAELGDKETVLPVMEQGMVIEARAVKALRHETQPPARYTEASLVKKLEEEGIGRPSTYASIMGTIMDRGYVFKKGNALVPTFTAFAVTDLLERHFGDLVDLGFTSRLEEELDGISRGELDWKTRLADFYFGDIRRPGLEKRVVQEEAHIEIPRFEIAPPEVLDTSDVPRIPVVVKVGKYGPYVQYTDNSNAGSTVSVTLPDDIAPADFLYADAVTLLQAKAQGPRVLGLDPKTGAEVAVKTGRYGPYVEMNEVAAGEEAAAKSAKAPAPRRASIPATIDPEGITLEQALTLLALPRTLGRDHATGEEIVANNGRFGPYVQRGKEFRSLTDGDDVYTIGIERALELLAQPRKGFQRAAAQVLKVLGSHPQSGAPVEVKSGRYGPYVTDGTTNATLPKGMKPEEFSLEAAVALLAQKAAEGPKAKPAAKGRGKSAGDSPKAAGRGKASSSAGRKSSAPSKTAKVSAKSAASARPSSKKPAAKPRSAK